MHYFEDQKISFNYNSDCSGNVHIRDGRTNEMLEIPMSSILNFVGYIKRNALISELEQKSARDILGL